MRHEKNVHWPQKHNNVARTILSKAKCGVRVVYIPGNHDELLRDHDSMRFGNVIIRTVEYGSRLHSIDRAA
jgi:UDP-2,3-diacylglucosamine pyrophosphatase LpxH